MYLDPAGKRSLDFDLYVAQRKAAPGWRDRIEGADLYATLLMRSRIQGNAVDRLRAVAGQAGALLGVLPDRDLGGISDQEFQSVSADLAALFDACRVRGVRLAIATKLLCQKRPYLIPMLDGDVQSAIGRPRGIRQLKTPGVRSVAYIERFRELMRQPLGTGAQGWSNLAALTHLAATLTDVVSKHLKGLGVAPPHPDFSPARILDKLVYFDWQAYLTYGWGSNAAAREIQPP
jgi:hypothetical protein